MKRIIILIVLIVSAFEYMHSQNWDYIVNSGEYYYGEAVSDTEEQADKDALARLCSMIAVNVSSNFGSTYSHTVKDNKMEHNEFVRQCILTYTSSTLTNCERMTMDSGSQKIVRRWMRRSELSRIYESRIAKARDMVTMAGEALEYNKVGIALQYYYWAYSLLCSIQYPNEVKDDKGHILVNWIPSQMRYILSDIKVVIDQIDDENIDLLFTYKESPVSELEFNYNDGREICVGKAKDGRGTMQMIPDYDGNVYHLNIEYEYKSLSRGDAEMESVLNVVGRITLPEAFEKLRNRTNNVPKKVSPQTVSQVAQKPSSLQSVDKSSVYVNTVNKIISALRNRRHTDAYPLLTLDGREKYDKLIGYGKGRIIGEPNIHYYNSYNGDVVARGLQMSFSFRNGTKTTFVEDVVFTLDRNGKVKNIAFGLGKDTENGILAKKVKWKEETRENLVEFLENYKTAYCLKRLDYIRDIFADDAIIIVGNVTRVYTQQAGDGNMTLKGRNIISTNRYTKDRYLQNLARCFRNNEFINIRFRHSDIQKLEKASNQDIICVQLAQDYNSSSYADQGYLFLMIDMSDSKSPFIKVRTWQPEPDPKFGYYNAGDFYDE